MSGGDWMVSIQAAANIDHHELLASGKLTQELAQSLGADARREPSPRRTRQHDGAR